MAASATSPTTASTTTTTSASGAPAAPATISAVAAAVAAVSYWRGIVTVKVRLAFIFEIASTLDGHGRSWRALALLRNRTVAPTHLGALFLQNRFTRQTDAIAFHGQHLYQHLVAFLQLVADIFDPMLGYLADVQQTIGSRQNLDKRPEVREPRHRAQVGLPHLSGRGNVADHLQRLGGRTLVVRSHVHLAAVIHIDFHTGLVDDAADHLSARPDKIANLVGRNLQRVEPWGIRRNLGARLRQHFAHLVEDEHPAPLGLRQGFPHDLWGNTAHLDVHLQSCDAILGAGNLEVHVAIVVLCTRNVGENRV